MAEKLLEDVDELFVGKPTWTSETKTVGLEIPKFLKKIEEEETVTSPRFKISEVEFYIKVSPGNDDPEFVSVDVLTGSEEPPTTSVSFLEGTGAMASWKMREIKKGGLGCGKFLPHQRFKAWAKNHGDVFKLKATITLHQKGNTTVVDWIRYCNPCKPCVNIFAQEPARKEAEAAGVSEKRDLHLRSQQGHHAGRGYRGFYRQLRDQVVQSS